MCACVRDHRGGAIGAFICVNALVEFHKCAAIWALRDPGLNDVLVGQLRVQSRAVIQFTHRLCAARVERGVCAAMIARKRAVFGGQTACLRRRSRTQTGGRACLVSSHLWSGRVA